MANEKLQVLEIVLAAIGGLGAKYGIDFFKSRRESNRIDFTTILNRLDEEIKELKKENLVKEKERVKLQARVFDLEGQLLSLRDKILLLESAQNDSPLPMWLKDTDGTMLAINGAYEEMFLKPNGLTIRDYLGKKDHDVWPKEIADQYRSYDNKVLKSGRPFRGKEVVKIVDKLMDVHIIKYVRYSGPIKIGIAGIAIPQTWVT